MASIASGTGAGALAGVLERTGELSLLEDCLDAVDSTRSGQLLLVGGEAGVGKTTLVRTFCAERGKTSRILWGACDPLFTPRPLGPLLGMAQVAGGELEAVVNGGATPYEVLAALARELGARTPTIFVIEDVHWADEATLDVLRLLARRVETLPTLVVASYRDDVLDNAHPLRIVLGELATSRSVTRLKLARLSPEAVAQLAEPHGVDGDELYGKTAGNPFFVVEALAAAGDGIPDTVRDAVLARVARLSADGRSLLEAVAVVPPRAEPWLLEAIAGKTADRVDECLASGVLEAAAEGVAFRHELARLAVEDSIAPPRKVRLHRAALAALADPPGGVIDLARLAHHAEAAGDVDAVLRFAPAAGDRAASLGAYREAAAQYARALRVGGRLSDAERADLHERRSHACYLTDQNDEAIEAIEAALECRRALGDVLGEGNALCWLSCVLWCPGKIAEADRTGREAVALLETLPEGRELAMAYANLGHCCAAAAVPDEAVSWGGRALDLAERLGETEIAVHARITIGVCELATAGPGTLERSLELAQGAGLDEQVARAHIVLASSALAARRYELAARHVEEGLDFCSTRGLERDRLYLMAYRAKLELDQGAWAAAATSAEAVLRVPRSSVIPRIVALVVLGLVRARRGDPDARAALDEAWSLAVPTGELPRLERVAAARAEAAWLEGDRDAVAATTDDALRLATERRSTFLAAELAEWRRRSGLEPRVPPDPPEPYAFQFTAEPERAAALWRELGCPYEAALALADVDAKEQLWRALAELQELGARPAAAIVARRLRALGVRGIPRGPRRTTQRNPAGLTVREVEVLSLLADGLRNSEIAARLVLSERTVDHHVAAILRKLGVRTRAQAGAEAVRLGLAAQDR